MLMMLAVMFASSLTRSDTFTRCLPYPFYITVYLWLRLTVFLQFFFYYLIGCLVDKMFSCFRKAQGDAVKLLFVTTTQRYRKFSHSGAGSEKLVSTVL